MLHRLLICLLLVPLFCLAQPKQLTREDVRPAMEEMLKYHVEYKKLSSVLVKRSFKLFIEQFDAEKLYFTADEIKPFLELSEGKAEEVIHAFQGDLFPDYEALNLLIERSILRGREIRKEVERELILSFEEPKATVGESYSQYPVTQRQLRERMKKKLLRFLAAEKREKSTLPWTPERRAKIFAFLEKRLRRFETLYLSGEKREHYFSMHLLKALAKSLDAHTAFFSPEEAFEMRTSLEKQFEGIGVVLKEDVEGVLIVDLIKGGPAERCGKIAKGDLLVAVDGSSIVDDPYETVLEKMQGKGGKEILLSLRRNEEELHIPLVREKIMMEAERLHFTREPYGEGSIVRLILPSFYESGDGSSCERDMREALRQIKTGGKISGLVLDLRENSGGFLNQAVKVAGLFISSGVIVISKYSEGEIQYLRDIDGRIYYQGPLIVLTSKASASAAEIVAQALQDYGVALVVGDERTYGKGSIQFQNVTEKSASTFFKVTVGKYYTVSGRSTQIEGVKADIVVPTEYSIYNIGERYLEYPLKNDHLPAAYIDPLTDIDQRNRLWFQQYYLPHLQKKDLSWIKMLPTLKANSTYRLEHNPNFKAFLKSLSPTGAEDPSLSKKWGTEDLQSNEAADILRDMISLKPTK